MTTAKLFHSNTYVIDGQARQMHHCAADDRLRCVARCEDIDQLREALGIEGLQKSVRVAIERRLRKLGRGQ